MREPRPQIDIVDSTWIGAPAGRVAAAVADPAAWPRWWPRLRLVVAQDRGVKGMRWAVPAGEDGTVRGSMEVWLEPAGDGVIAHYFLRLDATSGSIPARRARTLTERYRAVAKALFWGVGDSLDPDRLGRLRPPPPAVAADAPILRPVASAE